MIDAYDTIRRDVLDRIERRRLHPDGDEIAAEVARAVDDFQRRAHRGEEVPLGDPAGMIERVVRSVTDLGPFTELVVRPDVEEIFVEGARVSYLDGSGRLRGLATPTSEDENRQIVERLLAATDRQLTTKTPIVQARVLQGTARLTAAIPPVADRLSVTLRRYTVRDVTLDDLARRGALTSEAAGFLWAVMQLRCRIAVSGEPGAGKTTLVAALLAAAPPGHCVRTCEEIREIAVPVTHGAYYEARPPALDGTGEISLRDLVRFVLAMRPDRIVVGEVRGAEAFELSRAVNAGCGFLCTVHANSARESLHALVNAALMAGENVTEDVMRKVFSESLDLVVHLDRDDLPREGNDGLRRQVMEIATVMPSMGDGFTVEPVFAREALGRPLRWTGLLPEQLAGRVDRALPEGMTVRGILEGRVAG